MSMILRSVSSAKAINSGRDAQPIFSRTRLRWSLTVAGADPFMLAISLNILSFNFLLDSQHEDQVKIWRKIKKKPDSFEYTFIT
jgi:hypothetical protein